MKLSLKIWFTAIICYTIFSAPSLYEKGLFILAEITGLILSLPVLGVLLIAMLLIKNTIDSPRAAFIILIIVVIIAQLFALQFASHFWLGISIWNCPAHFMLFPIVAIASVITGIGGWYKSLLHFFKKQNTGIHEN